MPSIFEAFIDPKNKKFKNEKFSFELIKSDDPKAELADIRFNLFLWDAIEEKQKAAGGKSLFYGYFQTDSLIETKEFSILLDLVFKNWEFYQLPKQEIRNALHIEKDFFNSKVEAQRDLSIIRLAYLTKTKCNLISNGIKILENKKNRRFNIALHRFSASYKRSDLLDSVLDCCSCLEALYNLSNELRLKISLISYHLVSKDKKFTLESIYEMYGIRNNFIHGNKIPDITFKQVKTYINLTSEILISIIKNEKLPIEKELTKKIFDFY